MNAGEAEHALLQIFLPGDRRDHRARALRTGQGDTRDTRVADDLLDLVVGRKHVDVGALRQPGVDDDLLNRQRRLRDRLGVLEHDGVAQASGSGSPNRAIW